jgi:hypothetical protein
MHAGAPILIAGAGRWCRCSMPFPVRASREQRLRARRGGQPRKKKAGQASRLETADLVTAALIIQHLGVSQCVLAPFLGVHPVTLSQALRHVTRALALIPQPPAAPPPGAPPRTRDELLAYAAARGIDP